MSEVRYGIFKASVKVDAKKDYSQIKTGISMCYEDSTYEELVNDGLVFNSVDYAIEDLTKFESTISYEQSYGSGSYYYDVTEYFVAEILYDEDGERMRGDIIEYTPLQVINQNDVGSVRIVELRKAIKDAPALFNSKTNMFYSVRAESVLNDQPVTICFEAEFEDDEPENYVVLSDIDYDPDRYVVFDSDWHFLGDQDKFPIVTKYGFL